MSERLALASAAEMEEALARQSAEAVRRDTIASQQVERIQAGNIEDDAAELRLLVEQPKPGEVYDEVA